jgi:hypothetical protein
MVVTCVPHRVSALLQIVCMFTPASLTCFCCSLLQAFEKETTLKLDPTLPYMVRLDGHRFSKYTSSLHKPYDVRCRSLVVICATSPSFSSPLLRVVN